MHRRFRLLGELAVMAILVSVWRGHKHLFLQYDEKSFESAWFPPLVPAEPIPNATESPLEEFQTLATNCRGKERLLRIAVATGMNRSAAEARCDDLPSWKDVVDLYGSQPVILGLEHCAAYRAAVRDHVNRTRDAYPKFGGLQIDGMFNVGTNALAQTVLHNLDRGQWVQPDLSLDDPEYWEKIDTYMHGVGWGKHTLVKYRPHNAILSLPVVIVRDPYRWMKSMCKAMYRAHWIRPPNHCPNLVLTPQEKVEYPNHTTFAVTVEQNARNPHVRDNFDSLADYWTAWYQSYWDANIPRLVIRFEDMLFHADAVVQALSECTGSERVEPFQYYTQPAKVHGESSDFLTALAKTGTEKGRYSGMTVDDRAYAAKALNAELMQKFGYRH